MKVLHIAHYDTNKGKNTTFTKQIRNGLERCLTTLIEGMPEQVEQYIVMFDKENQVIFIEQLNKQGEVVFYTFYQNVDFSAVGLEKVFIDLQAKLAVDIVHIYYLVDFTLGIPKIFNKLNIPVISTIIDESFLSADYGLTQNYKWRQEVQEFFAPQNKLIFLHNVIYQRFLEYYPEISEKSQIIPCGITYPKIATINADEKFKILFLGRFNYFKGADIIAEIIDEVANEKFTFHLLGSIEKTGVPFTSIQRYSSSNLEKKVSEINPDLIIIPSIVQESFSYTAAEATALGYPLLTFNAGALSVIETERRGFVVGKMTAAAMITKIEFIAKQKQENPKWWHEVLQDVAKYQNFSEKAMIDEYLKIYQKNVSGQSIAANLNYSEIFAANFTMQRRTESQIITLENEIKKANQKINQLNDQVAFIRSRPIHNLIRYIVKIIKREPIS